MLRVINEGTVEGLSQAKTPPTHDRLFYQNLRHSNEVFAAFKVHQMGEDMAAKLFDASGNLKSFDKWLRDVSSISSHQVGAWLRTEYDTAVIRAHAAADWQEFERNKDIFPNLRWMPTTSPEPESTHAAYWRMKLTLPVDDPFWNEHHPGDRWNCKCSLEATDEPVVRPVDLEPTQPQRGLENNPGKDGHTFSDNHPYFPKNCSQCFAYKNSSFKNRLKTIFLNREKDCYNCPFIDGCVPGTGKVIEKAKAHIKEIKEQLNKYQGALVKDEHFITGQMRVLRRTLDDIFEHDREEPKLIQWLSNFSLDNLKQMRYKGYAENRPYAPGHKNYDPKNPNKKKHPETDYFLYYSIEIEGKTFWANVKMHKHYKGEVLYTIETKRPDDLIDGIKK